MNKTNPEVDEHLEKAQKWQKEMKQLRKILLDCQLTEELKWGQPCYTFEGKNIIVIGAFKEYSALLFFKGALLKDAKNILVQPGETQSGRQIRFINVREIKEMEAILKVVGIKGSEEAVDLMQAIFPVKKSMDIAGMYAVKVTEGKISIPEHLRLFGGKIEAQKANEDFRLIGNYMTQGETAVFFIQQPHGKGKVLGPGGIEYIALQGKFSDKLIHLEGHFEQNEQNKVRIILNKIKDTIS